MTFLFEFCYKTVEDTPVGAHVDHGEPLQLGQLFTIQGRRLLLCHRRHRFIRFLGRCSSSGLFRRAPLPGPGRLLVLRNDEVPGALGGEARDLGSPPSILDGDLGSVGGGYVS